MKREVLGLLSLVLGVTSSFAALKQGDTAPDFKAQASLAGKEFTFSLRDALKKGPVVVYFYPAAFTGGCNLQAHTFAEDHDKFAAAGASVIGGSLDSISRLNDFSADPNIAPASCRWRRTRRAKLRNPTTSKSRTPIKDRPSPP